ncbi:MAG: envelope fusion protein [Candidatus Thiodiazotropha sp.]
MALILVCFGIIGFISGKTLYGQEDTVETVSKYYEQPKLAGYRSTFETMQTELNALESLNLEITSNFQDISYLSRRARRGVFNWVGDAMSWLFGTLSSEDLSGIRTSIGTLASNQQEISHVLERSLSILNMTRVQVRENRQSINEIIDSIGEINEELGVIRRQLSQVIYEVQQFIHITAELDSVIESLKITIQKSTYYFLHLQIQLNALTLNKLTPSIIRPTELKSVLKAIETKLPKSYGLPADIDTDLWEFYKQLTCNTVIENNRILIVVPIPLIDYSKKMELYKIYNMPVPLAAAFPTDNTSTSEMLTYYKLESPYLAINAQRTQYMLLQQSDRDTCHLSFPNLCALRKPMYQVNLARMCVIALFMRDKIKVKHLCPTMVKMDNNLPRVQYMSDDLYIIITRSRLSINLACENSIRTKINIDPPYGFIRVNKQCTATSDRVTLTGVYEHGSSHKINEDALLKLESYNFSSIRIWDQFKQPLSLISGPIKVPSKLKPLEEIPVDQLIDRLHQLGQIQLEKEGKKFPIWAGILIGLVILFFVVLGIVWYRRWGRQFLSYLRSSSVAGSGQQTSLSRGHKVRYGHAGRQSTVYVEGNDMVPSEDPAQHTSLINNAETTTQLNSELGRCAASKFLQLKPTVKHNEIEQKRNTNGE